MFDFLQWCKDQNPDTIPFRPGAVYTTPFGLRTSQSVIDSGGSPGHLGVDRGSHDKRILMPFDGFVFWKMVGGVAGSLLQIIPRNYELVEIQVFHTVRTDKEITAFRGSFNKGDVLPIIAGDIGFSAGTHTHTELITEFSPALQAELINLDQTFYVKDQELNPGGIDIHVFRYRLNKKKVIETLDFQIDSWGIIDLSGVFAIRQELPLYRRPHWGRGKTIHVDSRRFLQI